jgi:hypothetical protein
MGEDTLSRDDQNRLADVLDLIIPASKDGRLPSAGSLRLAELVWDQGPDLRPGIREGLSTLYSLTRERGSESLTALSSEDRSLVLEAVATKHPFLMPGLVFHTYVHYYQQPEVVEALGLEARPPHPKGFELETGDLSLLDPVRDRGPLDGVR